jgi:hypothetical protein
VGLGAGTVYRFLLFFEVFVDHGVEGVGGERLFDQAA